MGYVSDCILLCYKQPILKECSPLIRTELEYLNDPTFTEYPGLHCSVLISQGFSTPPTANKNTKGIWQLLGSVPVHTLKIWWFKKFPTKTSSIFPSYQFIFPCLSWTNTFFSLNLLSCLTVETLIWRSSLCYFSKISPSCLCGLSLPILNQLSKLIRYSLCPKYVPPFHLCAFAGFLSASQSGGVHSVFIRAKKLSSAP